MRRQNRPDRLDELLNRLCEDALSENEREELAQLLEESSENRSRYLDYMELHSALWQGSSTAALDPATSLACAPDVGSAGDERAAATASPIRPLFLVAAGAFVTAASLLVVFGLYRTAFDRNTPLPRPRIADHGVPEPTDNGIAVLTRIAGVQWTSEAPLAVGDTLPPGDLAIDAGLLELEFYSGAALILEGPARLELVSRDLCLCHSGKVHVHVPRQARGFTVLSPDVRLVDLGTEFGMEVKPSRETEVHVFDGKVELFPPGGGGTSDSGEEITAGNAVRIRRMGKSVPLDSAVTQFASALELDRRVRLENGKRQAQLKQHWKGLANDDRTIVAYAFEPQEPRGRTLRPIREAGTRLDGAIVGCRWAQGRWPGKSALEFKRPGDRVRIHVPGQFESLTLAAWIRVDGLDREYQTLMLTDGFNPGEPHWQITRGGRLMLGVRQTLKEGNNYNSASVFDLSRLGQWVHVACVYDREAREVRHYVDGQLVETLPIVTPVPLRIGDAEIGNWGAPVEGSPTPVRSFNGRIDEFIVSSKAFSAEQIHSLYEQGKP